MIHYILGLEVLQRTDEIFLSQGEYTADIFKKFEILNFKPVAIPMMTNLKKISLSSFNFDKIDLAVYRQLIR
jgi:hypothetical protein